LKELAIDCKVPTGPDPARVEREERRLAGRSQRIKYVRLQIRRPPNALIKVSLARGVEMCGGHEAGDTAGIWVSGEASCNAI
jgi:hypothetical protein